MYYLTTSDFSQTGLGRLMRQAAKLSGLDLIDLSDRATAQLIGRFGSVSSSFPPRLAKRLAALELGHLEGIGFASEDVLFLRRFPEAEAPKSERLVTHVRPSGSVSTAMMDIPRHDPVVKDALDRFDRYINSFGASVDQEPTPYLADIFVARALAQDGPPECDGWRHVICEVRPAEARLLGTADWAQESPAHAMLLPLDELRQHDETASLLREAERTLLSAPAYLSAMLRLALEGKDTEKLIRADTPRHLGGHKDRTNLDLGALSYCLERFSPHSFLDVGCGPGGMVLAAAESGLRVAGIDGDPALPQAAHLTTHDFALGPIEMNSSYDLCWCVEFLEHVEERFMDNYLPALRACKTVVATLAPPGQPGHHHVNCQPVEYWSKIFGDLGMFIDDEATKALRQSSTMHSNFIRDNGFVFVRLQRGQLLDNRS